MFETVIDVSTITNYGFFNPGLNRLTKWELSSCLPGGLLIR